MFPSFQIVVVYVPRGVALWPLGRFLGLAEGVRSLHDDDAPRGGFGLRRFDRGGLVGPCSQPPQWILILLLRTTAATHHAKQRKPNKNIKRKSTVKQKT